MSWFSLSKKGTIDLQSVDIGRRIQVPVADIMGKKPGKTLLVTAGMDGDEYAGIAAAYQLIEDFANGNFAGRLVVVPIVNMPGFAYECSQNPMDNKFPKLRFLGRPDGGPTDRLVYWLWSTYIKQADCWFDMHSGAITEKLNPFLWLYRTGAATDAFVDAVRDARLAETLVYEKSHFSSKAVYLAKCGCTYILAESGERGTRLPNDIERHVRWVHGVMQTMGMEASPVASVARQQLYRKLSYYAAPCDGIWESADDAIAVKEGTSVGTIRRFDGSLAKTLHFRQDGVRLWWKETMAARKGDLLAVVAYN